MSDDKKVLTPKEWNEVIQKKLKEFESDDLIEPEVETVFDPTTGKLHTTIRNKYPIPVTIRQVGGKDYMTENDPRLVGQAFTKDWNVPWPHPTNMQTSISHPPVEEFMRSFDAVRNEKTLRVNSDEVYSKFFDEKDRWIIAIHSTKERTWFVIDMSCLY